MCNASDLFAIYTNCCSYRIWVEIGADVQAKVLMAFMLKNGIALGGGGARGLAHIGVIKALEELIKEVPELKEDTKKEFAAQAKAKFISEKITGDKAEVVYSFLHEGKTKKETVKLKKVKNEWKIDE